MFCVLSGVSFHKKLPKPLVLTSPPGSMPGLRDCPETAWYACCTHSCGKDRTVNPARWFAAAVPTVCPTGSRSGISGWSLKCESVILAESQIARRPPSLGVTCLPRATASFGSCSCGWNVAVLMPRVTLSSTRPERDAAARASAVIWLQAAVGWLTEDVPAALRAAAASSVLLS